MSAQPVRSASGDSEPVAKHDLMNREYFSLGFCVSIGYTSDGETCVSRQPDSLSTVIYKH